MYSTGNSLWCCVVTNGKEIKKKGGYIYMSVYDIHFAVWQKLTV